MENTYRVKIQGATPLIMHNCQGADPKNPYTIEKKPLMAKKSNKTAAHYDKLSELDFKSSLYWSEEMKGLYMPVDNISKMLLCAGRALDKMKGKSQFVGLRFTTHLGFELDIKNRDNFDALVKDPDNKYVRMVTINKAKNPSTRAIFNEWSFEADCLIDDEIVDPQIIESWWIYAGGRIGLGARRPGGPTPGGYGKFVVLSFKEEK